MVLTRSQLKKSMDSQETKREMSHSNDSNDEKCWISAIKTTNYMLKDPILDWLDLFGKKHGYIKDIVSENFNFTTFVMDKSDKFKTRIYELLNIKSCCFHVVF